MEGDEARFGMPDAQHAAVPVRLRAAELRPALRASYVTPETVAGERDKRVEGEGAVHRTPPANGACDRGPGGSLLPPPPPSSSEPLPSSRAPPSRPRAILRCWRGRGARGVIGIGVTRTTERRRVAETYRVRLGRFPARTCLWQCWQNTR